MPCVTVIVMANGIGDCISNLSISLCPNELGKTPSLSLLCYTHNHNIDLRTSMNERTLLYKNIYISHFILERVDASVVCERWVSETYTQTADFFPYLLPGARECQRLHPLASSSETPLVGCVSHARLRFSALCLNLTAWFSSRVLLPVTHLFNLSALIVLSCLLIITWQLVKAHGVTKNE